MRINYKLLPTDYIEELQASGKRMKARCFMEYYFDVQMGAVNSFGFYTRSWGGDKPMSKGTVHKWVKEFAEEIDKFWSYHQIKNQQHYSSVKKRSERRVNDERTNEPPATPKISELSKTPRTASERRVNEALNIYDDDKRAAGLKRRYFDDLYMIYRLNTKYAGKKEDAWTAYQNISNINHRAMIRSVVLYLHDKSIEKKYNLENFLRNEMYISYIDTHLRIKTDDGWLTGVYDDEREVFTASDGKEYILTPARLADKLAADELEFVIGAAA